MPVACGAGPWGLIERNSSTLHVAPWGDDDGDGSEDRPFETIQAAADAAGAAGGERVAVATGTYQENVVLRSTHDDVSIAGRCVDLAVVDGSGDEAAAIDIRGGDISVRDIEVTGGYRGIVVAPFGGQASARLENVWLRRNRLAGLFLEGSGAAADATALVVEETQPEEVAGLGLGVYVRLGSVTLVEPRLDGNQGIGLFAVGAGTSVVIEGGAIRGTRPTSDGPQGRGVAIEEGASLVASGLLIEGNSDHGLYVTLPDTTVEITDSVIRDTQPRTDGTNGRGIEISAGATLYGSGLVLEGNHDVGLFVLDDGRATLRDSAIRDTRPALDDSPGGGVVVQHGATLVASDVVLEGNHNLGLFVGGTDATADLQDCAIRDTLGRPDGTGGRAITAAAGATLNATRLQLEGGHDIGLLASGDGTDVTLEDSSISGVGTATDSAGGFGLASQDAASISADGLVVEDTAGPGIYVVDRGQIVGVDVALTSTGFAGAVVLGGQLTLEGGAVATPRIHAGEGGGVGVFSWTTGGPSDITLEGVAFSGLTGPALYACGPGRFAIAACDVSSSVTAPWLPGGVLATEGVERWVAGASEADRGSGLLLAGNSFHDLDGDAILLDGSSATLAMNEPTGMPNGFADLGGAPLVRQRCGATPDAQILDGSAADGLCRPAAVPLGPLLEYRLRLGEIDVIE